MTPQREAQIARAIRILYDELVRHHGGDGIPAEQFSMHHDGSIECCGSGAMIEVRADGWHHGDDPEGWPTPREAYANRRNPGPPYAVRLCAHLLGHATALDMRPSEARAAASVFFDDLTLDAAEARLCGRRPQPPTAPDRNGDIKLPAAWRLGWTTEEPKDVGFFLARTPGGSVVAAFVDYFPLGAGGGSPPGHYCQTYTGPGQHVSHGNPRRKPMGATFTEWALVAALPRGGGK